MGTRDSRTAERIPVENRVNLMVKGRVILAAIAVNISMGGLYVDAAAALPVGSPCEVAIFLPDGSGSDSFVAQGKIVRSGESGTAIQFTRMLGDKTLDAISKPVSTFATDTLAHAYMSYFKVSQSKTGADCEKAFGISRQTFKKITTTTFAGSIPVAVLPVWLLRAHIPAIPDWSKIAICFIYGAFWLLVLQPGVDLALFKALRAKATR